MKAIEILARILDYLFSTFLSKKAQDERNKVESSPADWFDDHFSNGVSSDQSDKTNKT